MASLLDYAALSAAVYQNARGDGNVLSLPIGWGVVGYVPGGGLNGFTAEAYKNGTDIVIAFKGTDTSLSGLTNAAGTAADGIADLALGAGLGSTQLFQAALFYQQVKAANPGANITFTGHSLGGGLASIMSVWFNKPATIFDEAPFEASALNPLLMAAVSAYLGLNGYSDSEFLSFVFTYPAIYGEREAQVTNNFVKGEALETLRAAWPTVLGTDKPIMIGGGASLSGLTLHSINLAAALLIQDKLRIDTVALPNLLSAIFDETLYAKPLAGDKADFLTAMLNDQIKVGYDNANGLLSRFAGDLDKLTNYGTNLKDGALGEALIDVAIADYYFMQNGFTKDFFTAISGGISFDLADIGAEWSSNKTVSQLDNAIVTQFLNGDQTARSFLAQDNAWSIQSGDTPLTTTGTGANNDAMIGGSGSDTMDGGAGNDFLYGGDGADTLTGGADNDQMIGGKGNDTLNGGSGYDTYRIEGSDTIADADGKGILKDQAGNLISGVIQKQEDGSYLYLSDPSISVTKDTDLTLTLTDGTVAIIKNFQSSNLGLYLGDMATQVTPLTINGDIKPTDTAPSVAGIQADANAQGNPIGTAQPYEDILVGSAGNDHILSGELNDDVNAGAGDDWVEGGNGNDYIGGRTGNDLIEGGAGSDILAGEEGNDRIYGNTKTDAATAIANGNNDTGSSLKGDWLAGNAGDDTLIAGADNDVLTGGAGADLLIAGAGDDNILGDADYTAQYQWEGAHRYTMGGALWYHSSADTFNWTVTPGPDSTVFAPVVGETSPAGGGADAIYAGAGNDHVWAGEGDDTVQGEGGNDTVQGESGSDVLLGGGGDDLLFGDDLDENAGDDYLDGEDGNDTLSGAAGADTLYGGAGSDKLYGDSSDTAIDKQGNDYLDGEAGDDTLFGLGGADTIFGGDGADYLQGDSGTGIGDSDDYLDGEAGDDTLLGEGGSDLLYGGDGADRLSGNAGSDTLYGEAGNDRIAGDNGGTDTSGDADMIDGGDGDDTIDGQGGDDTLLGGNGNDVIVGRLGNDALSGDAGTDQLQGGDGNDTLDGGADSDTLFGQAGNDTLIGGAGNDYLLGGAGDDILDGGDGDDVYYISANEGNDHIVDSGGTDWLVLQGIYWGDIVLGVGSLKLTVKSTGQEIHLDDFDPDNPLAAGGIEYFQFADGTVKTRNQIIQELGFTPTGTPGGDVLSGTALNDTITALAGNDIVTARGGNDTVYLDAGDDWADAGDGDDIVWAGDGNDIVNGGNGADRLVGGLGADILAGGSGNDALEGGEGNDTYLFGTGYGQDAAIDSAGIDTVQLTGGLTEAQINLQRLGSDLIVAVKGAADKLTAKDWFSPAGNFQSLMLGDGTVLDRAAVEERLVRNQAPVAMEDLAVASENGVTQASGNALANDADPEGRTLRVTNPGAYIGSYGALTLNSAGAYAYTLDNNSAAVQSLAAGQTVTERFGYTATDDDPDGAANSSSAIVVSITGANDAPIVAVDWGAVAEDGTLSVAGNVLANDRDIDAGTVLQVVSPDTIVSAYGSATLASDGSYTYTLNNASTAVQSLGRNQQVTERFGYTVSDGIAGVVATLEITVAGANDAPMIATALSDQSVSANTAYSWQVPANSFIDPDYGDVLVYSVTLADGSALPSWLAFDAATQTFSGRVPRDAAGSLDISVTATDGVAGQSGNLSASDVFSLSFASGGGGGGNGGNGGSKGNEGVGNGVDAPPPGHDYSFNDGAGTSPGHPGAQGGNGYRPLPDVARADIVIDALEPIQAGSAASVHGHGSSTNNGQHVGTSGTLAQDTLAMYGASSNGLALANGHDQEGTPGNDSISATAKEKSADAWQEPSYLDPSKVYAAAGNIYSVSGNTGVENTLARWAAMDELLVAHLTNNNEAALGNGTGSGAGMMDASGFLSSTTSFADDPLSLSAGNGNNLKTLQGLKEGFRQAA